MREGDSGGTSYPFVLVTRLLPTHDFFTWCPSAGSTDSQSCLPFCLPVHVSTCASAFHSRSVLFFVWCGFCVWWGFFKFFAVRLLSSLASGSCVLGYGNHLYVEQLRKGMTPSVCTSFTRMNEINAFQLWHVCLVARTTVVCSYKPTRSVPRQASRLGRTGDLKNTLSRRPPDQILFQWRVAKTAAVR